MDNKSPDENSRHTPGARFARHEWNAPPNPRKKSELYVTWDSRAERNR